MSRRFALTLHDMFLDGRHSGHVLHDFTDKAGRIDIDALVASGDYFATLATTLDEVSTALKHTEQEPESAALEHVINTLLYLERKYKIVKK